MDLFPRKKLGWFPTLRQASGYNTFFKHRFLRIQCYQNLYRRRVSLRNRLFDPDFFLRSTCPLKLSNFWGGTGYCSDIRSIINVILVSIVWRIEQYLAQSSSHTFSLIPMFPMFFVKYVPAWQTTFWTSLQGTIRDIFKHPLYWDRNIISSDHKVHAVLSMHWQLIGCKSLWSHEVTTDESQEYWGLSNRATASITGPFCSQWRRPDNFFWQADNIAVTSPAPKIRKL